MQLGVGAAQRDQFAMPALFDHLATLEQRNPIGARIVDNRWTMTIVVRPAISSSVAAWT